VTIKVVDTNVLVVANGDCEQADEQCELACIEQLEKIKYSRELALDCGGQILGEYSKKCSWEGGPGVGSEFFRWAHDTAHSNGLLVAIPEHPHRGYADFPDDPNLENFDNDDKKFVAVACACAQEAVVLNAVDSDYTIHNGALAAAGVSVTELCAQCLKIDIP
jgi:hypothetical protein